MASSRAALAGKAVKDCVRLVKTHDYPNFLASILIKDKQCQRAVFAVHAFNNAITSIPNQARDLKTRQLRFQFWLDALNQVYSNPKFVPEPSSANASKAQPLASTSASEASQPPSQRPMEPADMPIAVALQTPVLSELHWAVHTFGITRKWLSRVITARRVLVEHTAPLSNALANTHPLHGLMVGPFRSIADMEQYCERTFVGPMLASLEALRIRDVHTDHIASHVGQMLGIVSRLKAIPPLLINQNTVLLPIDLLMEKVPQLDYGPAIALRKSVTDKSVFRWSIEMQKIMNVLGTQFEPVVSALANRALDHFTIARELIERGSSARDVHAIPPGATAAPPPPAQPLPEAQRSQRPGATSTTAASPSASSSGKQSPFAAAQAMSGATPKQQTRSGPQSVESSQLQQQTQPKTDLKQTERERRDRLARAFPVYLPALHAYDYLRALDRAKYNVFDLRPISSARQHPVFLPISYSYHNWKMRL